LAHWITNCICWKPGFGHSIIIGKDCIIGFNQTSYISPQLISLLNTKNTYFLFQARFYNEHGTPTVGWKSVHDLELPVDLAAEWDKYFMELIRVRIYPHDVEDQFLWAGGDNSGHISVKKLYSAITNTVWKNNIIGWCKHL